MLPVVVLVVVIALVAFAPKIQANNQKTEIANQCRALQARLSGARVQGGDLAEAARLEAALRQCVADAQAAGETIDQSLVTLGYARDKLTQIRQEWAHYRSTGYDDAVKRRNTTGTIWRVGEGLVRDLRDAVMQATTRDALNEIRVTAIEAARESFDRGMCFDGGASGCGRFGTNEDPWHTRTLEEWSRVLMPIVGVVDDLPDERRAVWLRVRPRWERIGVDAGMIPRVARRGPDYGGITLDQVPRLRGAGNDPLLALIDARIRELAPQPDVLRRAAELSLANRAGLLINFKV